MSNIGWEACPNCGDKGVTFSGKRNPELETCKKCGKVFCRKDGCGKKYGYVSCPKCYDRWYMFTTAEQED